MLPAMLPWFEDGKFPLYLAPMAGFTDIGFRKLCKEKGADVVVSEFVLADAILRGDHKVWNSIEFTEDQRPMGVQIFGSESDVMAAAARTIVDRLNPDFIDLNFGCPAKKVTCKNAGSSLLRDLPLLGSICESVVQVLPDCPVTAKIRIGWDSESLVAPEAGKLLESVGIQALAIHGRTKAQGYKGDANWDIIHETAQEISIPVIGNGSIASGYNVGELRERYGVSGLMMGRSAIGNPWLFENIKSLLATGEPAIPPTVEERWDAVLRYADIMRGHYTHLRTDRLLGIMKGRLVSFVAGFPGARQLRNRISRLTSFEEIEVLRDESLEALKRVEGRVARVEG
ncbi:MAG: tRNA dihydrouridine synthase DusB [Verrucomicrobia bacterium]|nr:tRNA dihydrouridine synthase DusB [Verrucomicrobiota bacterium]